MPREHLSGDPVCEEGLEFGERRWRRLPRTTRHNAPLRPGWRSGVWLGRRRWASIRRARGPGDQWRFND
eukprot:1392694-Alexandrium_andersonii.AAC.1